MNKLTKLLGMVGLAVLVGMSYNVADSNARSLSFTASEESVSDSDAKVCEDIEMVITERELSELEASLLSSADMTLNRPIVQMKNVPCGTAPPGTGPNRRCFECSTVKDGVVKVSGGPSAGYNKLNPECARMACQAFGESVHGVAVHVEGRIEGDKK